jgi:uncharacterized peroxidase-related enzyme
MPRIAAIDPATAEPKTKKLLDGVQQKMGMVPNIMRTLAHSPAALESLLGFKGALAKGKLPAKLREQIAITVGELNDCHYCVAAHAALGKMVGLGDEEIADSRRGVSPDRKTEAVLQFARKIVTERGFVSDGDVAGLREVGYGDAEIVEIAADVGLNVFTNYFNHVVDTEIDFPEVEPLPKDGSCSCG